jgi:hypothetical protein
MACTCATEGTEKVRTYLILAGGDEIQIDIPESWKVTYGPVSPGKGGYGNDLALRIYENETKQRAIFTNVRSFRDLSIPVRRKVVEEVGSSDWEETEERSSNSKIVDRTVKWVTEGA